MNWKPFSLCNQYPKGWSKHCMKKANSSVNILFKFSYQTKIFVQVKTLIKATSVDRGLCRMFRHWSREELLEVRRPRPWVRQRGVLLAQHPFWEKPTKLPLRAEQDGAHDVAQEGRVVVRKAASAWLLRDLPKLCPRDLAAPTSCPRRWSIDRPAELTLEGAFVYFPDTSSLDRALLVVFRTRLSMSCRRNLKMTTTTTTTTIWCCCRQSWERPWCWPCCDSGVAACAVSRQECWKGSRTQGSGWRSNKQLFEGGGQERWQMWMARHLSVER